MHRQGWKALVLAVFVPCAASATTVLRQSFEQMTASAHAVVRGTVGAQEAHWDPAYRRIYTYTEVRLTEVVKGQLGPIVLVRAPGGVAEGLGQRVEGSPSFATGESVVLFLERAPDEPGVFQVSALAAGKVTLAPSKTGDPRATRDLRGISQYALGTIDRQPHLDVKAVEDLGPAELFLTRLRNAVRRGAK